jgi:transcriptional regulator with XRE-family HTH domain
MMEEFKRLQKAAGFTGRGVAEFLGIDYATVKRYRNGDLEVPKLVIMALSYCVKYGPDYAVESDKDNGND